MKKEIRKNKYQIQGSKRILHAQNGRKTGCMLAGQGVIDRLISLSNDKLAEYLRLAPRRR